MREVGVGAVMAMPTTTDSMLAITTPVAMRIGQCGRRASAICRELSRATSTSSPATFDRPDSGKRSRMRAARRSPVAMIAASSRAR